MRGGRALALALGVIGVVALDAAYFSSGFDRITGDEGDAREFVYLAEHWYQAFRGQSTLLSPGIFHPVEGALGYTDPIPAHSLPFSVLRIAGLDMFTALATTVVLFNLLNYASCFYLLHGALRVSAAAAAVGAAFFAFNSPRFNHPGHFNLLAAFFLPLAIAFLVRFGRRAPTLSRRAAFVLLSAAALCVSLQLLTSLYQGWFCGLWALVLLVLALIVPASRRWLSATVRRFWPAIAAGLGVFLIGLLPVAAIYLPVAGDVGPWYYGIVRELIPEWWSLLQMGRHNYVWGDVSAALSRTHPPASTELDIGIGLVASIAWLALTGWALVTLRRRAATAPSDRLAPDGTVFLCLTILATTAFYLVGMRYWNDASPWRVVYEVVPGADGLRGVARYVLFLALPMAIAFAIFLDRGMRRLSDLRNPRVRRSLAAAASAVVAFGLAEQLGRGPSISKSAELGRLRRLASRLPDECRSFYVAAAPGRTPRKYEYQIDAMLISAMRGVPTLNGYAGRVAPGWSLRDVEAPEYEARVASWIATHRVARPVCRLEIGD